MRLEVLPNEIFIECFEYLNALDIFYAFDQLNYRFYNLIRAIPLHLNCQHVRKSIFDQFCTTMLSTPEIKTQIHSLHLSNDNTYVPIKRFLSLFSLNEFSHLRSLTLTKVKTDNVEQLQSMLPLLSKLNCFRLINYVGKSKILLSAIPISQLRTLSVDKLDSILTSSDAILPIKNLTISGNSPDEFYQLFRRIPRLQYLHVQSLRMNYSSKAAHACFTDNYAVYLKQLTIDNFYDTFIGLTALLKHTPNLKSLSISSNSRDMIHASRWEDFITSSLPQLINFKFKFIISYKDDISDEFEQFQSDFWQEQHHWYTEYSFDKCVAQIYTIPYISRRYVLTPHTNRYQNQLMNHVNTFDSVSELIFYREAILLQNSHYFSNVTSLTLENEVYYEGVNEELHRIEHIYTLKTIVNLSHLRHLTISVNYVIIKSSSVVLFQLLKETSQLSSMTIELRALQLFFDNDELCKYLNKIITKLDIVGYSDYSFKASDQLEKFCQIFSNLEQLICYIKEKTDLLFLFNHLPKLSIMQIHFSTSANCHRFTSWLEAEARKLQLTIYVEFEQKPSQSARIWIDRNMH